MSMFNQRDAEINALRVKSAVHDQQIQDHDKVLEAIQEHLGALVSKVSGFERTLIILGSALVVSDSGVLKDFIGLAI